MENKKKLTNFICDGNFSNELLDKIEKDLLWDDHQLIKHTFDLIKYELRIYNKSAVIDMVLLNSAKLLSILCDRTKFSPDEVLINRKRIKRYRESILMLADKLHHKLLFDLANRLDEIVLEKDIKEEDLIKLLKVLIDKKEDINIIKRLLNSNKNAIINNTELFDYTFKLTIDALKNDSPVIYYYISLLKVFYSSKVDFRYYQKIIDENNLGYDIFVDELYNLIHGIKRSLNANEILDKYGIITDLPCPNIILPREMAQNEIIFTLDTTSFGLKDDAVSIIKKDNYSIVCIHITDPTYIVTPNSDVDIAARNNFKCLNLPDERIRIFNDKVERAISLSRGRNKRTLTLHVKISPTGEILNYKFERGYIKVSENLTFEDGNQIIQHGTGKRAEQLRQLYDVALALETRNPEKGIYWHKKETDSIDKAPVKHMSDKIISELMVLYNFLLAQITKEKGIPYVYRVHDNSYIKDLFTELNIEANDSVKNLISNIYLPSKFSVEPLPHYGTNLPYYSHSTNPGREYTNFYNQILLHHFYFHDLDYNFTQDSHEKLVDYFNQRNVEMELFKGEYIRERKMRRD